MDSKYTMIVNAHLYLQHCVCIKDKCMAYDTVSNTCMRLTNSNKEL